MVGGRLLGGSVVGGFNETQGKKKKKFDCQKQSIELLAIPKDI